LTISQTLLLRLRSQSSCLARKALPRPEISACIKAHDIRVDFDHGVGMAAREAAILLEYLLTEI
jgi:hypothetical protein